MLDTLPRTNGNHMPSASRPLRGSILGGGLATGFILFYASQIVDQFLYRRNIPGTMTVIDNAIIGALGGVLLVLFVSGICAIQSRTHEEERLLLAAELKQHIRNALTAIVHSADLPNAESRRRAVRAAVHQIQSALGETVPSARDAQPCGAPGTYRWSEYPRSGTSSR
jgi:hypothetical protein